MKYAIIESIGENHAISKVCRILECSERGFYAWRARSSRRASRVEQKATLTQAIIESFRGSNATYGSPRVWSELQDKGVRISRRAIAKIMRDQKLVARVPRRFLRAGGSAQSSKRIHPNYLNRHFEADAPNAVWVGDITELKTKQGLVYLATVIDLYSRRVIGWCASELSIAQITVIAFRRAVMLRNSAPQMFHSDQGTQYASVEFERVAKGTLLSMSRKANCLDNAVAESFFSTLKIELTHRHRYTTRQEAIASIESWMNFYNYERRHSTLDYKSPVAFETLSEAA